MIIEGSHKATGNGIFVSDIQEKSAAFHVRLNHSAAALNIFFFQSGLKVGDMLLAINTETFLAISYDDAVGIIKSLGGNVKMLVTNPKEEDAAKAEAEGETIMEIIHSDRQKGYKRMLPVNTKHMYFCVIRQYSSLTFLTIITAKS